MVQYTSRFSYGLGPYSSCIGVAMMGRCGRNRKMLDYEAKLKSDRLAHISEQPQDILKHAFDRGFLLHYDRISKVQIHRLPPPRISAGVPANSFHSSTACSFEIASAVP